MRLYILRPSARQRAKHVREALADYPLLELPHRKNAIDLTPDAARENERFLLDQMPDRMAALGDFLRRFNVEMGTGDAALAAVSAWFPDHAGLLTTKLWTAAARFAFFSFSRPWVGPLRGLNAIFDLGLFFGESMLSANPACNWRVIAGGAPPWPGQPTSYTGIFVEGAHVKRFFEPIAHVYSACASLQQYDNVLYVSARERAMIPQAQADSFRRYVRTYASPD
jgi:hypothetical protein